MSKSFLVRWHGNFVFKGNKTNITYLNKMWQFVPINDNPYKLENSYAMIIQCSHEKTKKCKKRL